MTPEEVALKAEWFQYRDMRKTLEEDAEQAFDHANDCNCKIPTSVTIELFELLNDAQEAITKNPTPDWHERTCKVILIVHQLFSTARISADVDQLLRSKGMEIPTPDQRLYDRGWDAAREAAAGVIDGVVMEINGTAVPFGQKELANEIRGLEPSRPRS